MKFHWWNKIPLKCRLTFALVGLLTFGLLSGTTAMIFYLQNRLVAQIDDQLVSTAHTINAVSLELITGSGANRLLPSDHYILLKAPIYGTIEWVPDETVARYGKPDLSNYSFPSATISTATPTTIPNIVHDAAPWRAITIATATADGVPTGTITIALPMRPADATISLFLQRVFLVDIAVIVLGALVGGLVVTRFLRPLKQIEHVAEGIAQGDLSQRVPEAYPTSTEVGSLSRSLNTMLTQIEDSFAAQEASERRMRRFVSDASHELRTPLATVRGYGELYRLGGIPDEELPRAIGRIESESTRMSGLVEDLLALARLDEERPLRLESVDLVVIAADAAADLRALDPSRAVAVIGLNGQQVEPTLARGDESQLRQVVANLIGNVAKHTPEGTPVELAIGISDGAAAIEVRDHGAGVPGDERDKIFGRFYRIDASRSRTSGGSGLGLAIVAAIVSAHSGTITTAETPGGGLTVKISLPLAPK